MNSLKLLQLEVAAFSDEKFPGQTIDAKIAHLADEVAELADKPSDGEEMADCLLLLAQIAEMQGVDLMAEALKKLVKNKERVWGEADHRGVIKHVA